MGDLWVLSFGLALAAHLLFPPFTSRHPRRVLLLHNHEVQPTHDERPGGVTRSAWVLGTTDLHPLGAMIADSGASISALEWTPAPTGLLRGVFPVSNLFGNSRTAAAAKATADTVAQVPRVGVQSGDCAQLLEGWGVHDAGDAFVDCCEVDIRAREGTEGLAWNHAVSVSGGTLEWWTLSAEPQLLPGLGEGNDFYFAKHAGSSDWKFMMKKRKGTPLRLDFSSGFVDPTAHLEQMRDGLPDYASPFVFTAFGYNATC